MRNVVEEGHAGPFIRIPDIPEGITEPEADVLRMVDTFVQGKSLPIDIEMFLPAIMSAANSGEPLQDKDKNRLTFIESKGEPWSYLATATRAVLANRPILLPRDLFLPQEVASTIKVLEGYRTISPIELMSGA
ncbi:MAG TPA: hypothetical protein VEA61_11115 [Allosphingosinicella sp.]|nr:hypothetical protein [Allosphingosinicella sp.]